MRFQEFELHRDLQKGIDEAGFAECTEVQARTLPHTLQGQDLTVQSQTGTGKTAAFLIPIFQHLLQPEFAGAKALILAPTRELAVQIEDEAQLLGKHLPFSTACFYGGVGYGKQEAAIRSGAQILIATPGRLLDFVDSGKLGFQDVRFVVIDEADRLFDMGFYPDIQKVFRRMPARDRMTMLFSATLGTRVQNIAWKYMSEPVEIVVTPEQMTVETVTQELYHVALSEKIPLLLGLLRREQPETALVFANTKRACEEISRRLEFNGFKSRFIIGDLPQRQRLRLIDDLKGGQIEILVATDVAARGLHVDDLDLVVNYDLPEDPENYVHRIGRTARAGKKGRAISLACERFVYGLEAIESLIGTKIPSRPVTDGDLVEDKSRGTRIVIGRDERTRGGAPHTARPPRRGSGSGGRKPRRYSGRSGRDGAEQQPAAGHKGSPESEGKPRGGERQAARRRDHAPRSGEGKPHHKRPDSRHGDRKAEKQSADARGAGSGSVEERMEYYRRKYGEDFVLKNGADSVADGKRRNRTRAERPATEGRGQGGKQPRGRGQGGKHSMDDDRAANGRKSASGTGKAQPAAQASEPNTAKEKRGLFSGLRSLFGRKRPPDA